MKGLFKKVKELSGYSKLSIKMGSLMMLSFYIVGFTAYIIAPYVPNYFGAIAVFKGCLEAGPASFVSGVCAAVICDVAIKSGKP